MREDAEAQKRARLAEIEKMIQNGQFDVKLFLFYPKGICIIKNGA